ncbi:unnamed protein product [Cuscuta europaea]|uniref:Uncharacterized protein n=2 Tax=Cuscuta europaea TaxID=41803 RepID=A0A9P0YLR9_CUSEU|nr:unnamed protein product [Cuscuta europaea]
MENGLENENPLKPLKAIPDNGVDDDQQLLEGTPTSSGSSSPSTSPSASSSPSSSSSSSSSFEDESVDPEKPQHSPTPESASCPDISTHTPQWSMMSGSPSNSSPLSSFPENRSLPSIPSVTGQPAGYDPNRIPLTVFDSSRSNAPGMDWSVASTESLFSIHMGNASFSREHALLMMNKSGELIKTEDGTALLSSEATKYGNDRKSFSSTLPPVMEGGALDNEEKSEALPMPPESNVESPKPVSPKQKPESSSKIAASSEIHSFAINSANTSDGRSGTATGLNAPRLSDESGTSSSSFAFPLLVNDGGNAASLKSVPEKTEPEQLESQSHEGNSKEGPREVETSWFSYLFCLRRCS